MAANLKSIRFGSLSGFVSRWVGVAGGLSRSGPRPGAGPTGVSLCARLRCLLAFLPVAVLEQEPQRWSVPAARVVDTHRALLLWRRLKFRGHLTARPRPRGLLWPHWGREELTASASSLTLCPTGPLHSVFCAWRWGHPPGQIQAERDEPRVLGDPASFPDGTKAPEFCRNPESRSHPPRRQDWGGGLCTQAPFLLAAP